MFNMDTVRWAGCFNSIVYGFYPVDRIVNHRCIIVKADKNISLKVSPSDPPIVGM